MDVSKELLKKVVDIRNYQEKPSIANQGQNLDGYSALASYNELADKIKDYLRQDGQWKEGE